jgi:hypothetical protein
VSRWPWLLVAATTFVALAGLFPPLGIMPMRTGLDAM